VLTFSSDPEEARIPVPDVRFDWLCELYQPKSKVPAHLTIIDIAGLVAGASTGAGLGNAFLSHVRAVDGIFQVVRAFDDSEVIHVDGDIDPVRDMQVISTELRLKDIDWVEKELEKLKKGAKTMGGSSLAEKAKREEIVSQPSRAWCSDEGGGKLREGLGWRRSLGWDLSESALCGEAGGEGIMCVEFGRYDSGDRVFCVRRRLV
jgi:obg-like ATPase 1